MTQWSSVLKSNEPCKEQAVTCFNMLHVITEALNMCLCALSNVLGLGAKLLF
jgi:hypothetical protein